eukprot:1152736-Pelagomonas_calceolata.AAC.1
MMVGMVRFEKDNRERACPAIRGSCPALAAFQDEGMRAVLSKSVKSCEMYGASTLWNSRPLP